MGIGNSLSRLLIATGILISLGVVDLQAEPKSDIEAISAANLAFDHALSSRDINAMEKVWATEPYVIAIHPASKAIIIGWEGVRKSWESTFDRFGEIAVSMKDPHIHVGQSMAWIIGVEAIDGKLVNGESVSFSAFTTNVYEKHGGSWLMVSHITSRVP